MRFILFFILILFNPSMVLAVDIEAKQAIVIDFDTNEILFEKNSDQKISPASMTKIMAVYATFDRIKKTDISIEDKCIVSTRAYKMSGSRTFLEIDDQVTIDTLLKGITIQSGNDASVALAECLGGSESDFASIMNFYAQELGMINTNFTNSSGWPADNHYSTVYDLAILSNALIRDFPDLYTYFNLYEFTYNDINQPNRNKLLTNVEGADGLKTGYTKKSGWGIAGSAIRDERRITVVINGNTSSRSRLNESAYLLNWAFSQTTQKKLVNKGQIIKNVDVWLGNKSTINLIIEEDIVSILSFDQEKLIKTSISYSKPISAPIKKGEKLGEIKIIIPGKKILYIPLVAENSVKKIHPLFRILAAIKYLIFGTSLDEI